MLGFEVVTKTYKTKRGTMIDKKFIPVCCRVRNGMVVCTKPDCNIKDSCGFR